MEAKKLDIQVQGTEKVFYVTHHTKKVGKNTRHYTVPHNMGN